MQSKFLVMLAGATLASTALAQEQAAYKAELRSDAAQRTSLLAAGGAGKDDKGFFISDGGANKIYVKGYGIFRYTANWRSSSKVGNKDDFTHGFDNTVTRLGVEGTLWDPNFAYKIRGNFQNGGGGSVDVLTGDPGAPTSTSISTGRSGTFALDDAWMRYTWDNGFSMTAGQFKLPIFREENVGEEYQQAAARSVTNDYFSQMRSQGVMFTYQADNFRAFGAVSDGIRTSNTNWNSSSESDVALTARVEFMGAGNWNDWNSFNSFRGSNMAWMIGAAVHWETSGETGDGSDNSPAVGVETGADLLMFTIDGQVKGDGWNLYAAFLGANVDPEAAGAQDTDDFGLVIQGGFFVTDQVELFARWDALFIDKDTTTPALTRDDFHFGTFGLNYFLSPKSHAAKIQTDIVWAFNNTNELRQSLSLGDALPNTKAGQLGQDKSGEISWRLQGVFVF